MIANETFSVLFYVRNEKENKHGDVPIYCRVTVNGKRAEISTKRYIDAKSWNPKTNSVKGNSSDAKKINDHLRIVKNKLYDAQSYLFERNQVITAQKIKNLYLGKDDNRKTVLEVFQYHNDQIEKQIGKGYAKETHKKYNTTFNHLKNFIDFRYKVPDFYLKEINYDFVDQFDVYLRTERNCDNNVAVKYVNYFRKILRIALANDWIDKDPSLRYSGKIKEKKRPYLTKEEVKKIEDKEFTSERLDLIKDAFLFGCYTGLCYADVAKLTKEEILTHENGNKYILTDRTKTNVESYIPLNNRAKEIIEKYADHPKIATSDKVIPILSNQKVNSYLKEIQDFSGVEKTLTFHVSRHTFGTQMIENGYSMEVVKSMLGHTNIKQTQHYSHVTEERIWNEFNNLKK